MRPSVEPVLRMDLVAIAVGYNVPRLVAIPILVRAVAEMKRETEAKGTHLRERADKHWFNAP